MSERSCKRCDGPVEKRQRVCLSCKTQRCEWCDEEFVDHHARKYCSHACQHDHRSHEAITDHRFDCRGCGEPIRGARSRSGKGRTQRWCSVDCRKKHTKRKAAFRRHLYRVDRAMNPRTTKEGECRECGAEAPEAEFYDSDPRQCVRCAKAAYKRYYAQNAEREKARVRRYKRAHRRRRPKRVKTCRRCMGEFTTRRRRQLYCSLRCKNRAAESRRRAREVDAFVEDVSFTDIYLRDAGRCGICGSRVDRRCRVPHPKAPTIDHIVPLSRDGTHERSNVQLAHYRCNTLKRDGRAGSQLRLLP